MTTWIVIRDGWSSTGRARRRVRPRVVVEGERIRSVGTEDVDAVVPCGADPLVVDPARGSVMPGLIDAHCHMTYGESWTQEEQDLYTSVESRTLRARGTSGVLRAGVTSISQPGGSYYIGVRHARGHRRAGWSTGRG